MSKFVDERVVEMSFDNKRFETNVKTSMGTINKLKDSLDFSGTADSISRNLGGIDTSMLSSNLNSLGKGFSTLQIVGISAIAKITSMLIDFGIELAKTLSGIELLGSGWSKFQEMAISEATLLAQGYEQLAVTDAIERLLWFTDETSYSFVEMMSNMAKFTAAGVELEQAQNAMMGIANWAALSGQNAGVASRVMYQLSQAIGSGVVKLQDWRSIETANMATQEFKNMILETASSMGTLNKNLDGTFTLMDGSGKTFEANQFRDFLSHGFLTSEVLVKALESYSFVALEVQKMMDDDSSIRTASKGLDAYEQMVNDLEASYGDLINEEQKAEIAQKRFGIKAFRAAQEARTLTDAINSVKDAVSTGWTRIFSNIFGGVEEAKALWTDLANALYDIFMDGMWKRIDILGIWAENGGRDDLWANTEENTGAFWNLFNAIVAIKDLIGGAWSKVFGFSELEDYDEQVEDIATKLKTFTENLKEWTSKLFLSEDATEKLTNILTGLFSIFKIIGKTIVSVVKGFEPLLSAFGILNNELGGKLNLGKIFSDAGKAVTAFGKSTEFFESVTNNIKIFLWTIIDFIDSLQLIKAVTVFVDAFRESLKGVIGETDASAATGNFFRKVIDALSSAFRWLGELIRNNILPVFTWLGTALGWLVGQSVKLVQKIGELITKFRKWAGSIAVFSSIGSFFKEAIKNVSDFFGSFNKEKVKPFDNFTEDITDKLTPLKTFITGLKDLFIGLWQVIKSMFAVIGPLFSYIGKTLTKIGDKIKEMFTSPGGEANFAKIFTGGFWALVLYGIVRFADMLRSITIVFRDAFDSLFDYVNSKAMQQYMEAIKTMAISILLMVGALLILGSMDEAMLKKSLWAMGALVGFIVGVMILMKTLIKGTTTTLSAGFLKAKDIVTTTANLMGLGVAFMGLGVAIFLLAAALKMISKLDPETVVYSLLIMALMLGMMVGVMKIVGQNEKGVNKAVRSMVKVAISVALLARPLKTIGQIDTTTGIKGLIGIGFLMAILVGYSRFSRTIESSQKPVMGLLRTAIAITLLIVPLKIIGSMDWISLGKTGAAIAGLFIILTAASKAMRIEDTYKLHTLSWSLIKMAIGLSAFGVAMLIVSSIKWWAVIPSLIAIGGVFYALVRVNQVLEKKLTKPRMANMSKMIWSISALAIGLSLMGVSMLIMGSISWWKVVQSLIALGAVFYMLVKTNMILEKKLTDARMKNMLKMIWSISALAVGLGAFGIALRVISGIHWKKIAIGLGTIAVVLLMIVGLNKVLTMSGGGIWTLIAFGGALVLLSSGLMIFGIALLALGSIPVKTIRKGLLTIAGVFVILAVAAVLLKPVILTLLALALTFGIFAIGVFLISAAFTSFVAILAVSTVALTAGLIGLSAAIIAASPMLMEALWLLIEGLLVILINSIPLLVEALDVLIREIVISLSVLVRDLIVILAPLLMDILEVLSDNLPAFIAGSVRLFTTLSEELRKVLPAIMIQLGLFVADFVDGMVATFIATTPRLVNAGFDLVIGIMDGIGKTLVERTPALRQALIQLSKDMLTALLSLLGLDVVVNIGKDIVKGIIKGIKDQWKDIQKEVNKLAEDLPKWMKDMLGIKSPSTVFAEIGEFIDLGLSKGIKDNSGEIYDSVSGLGDEAMEGAKDSGLAKVLSDLGESLNSDFDNEVVIRPVLDLSEIQNGKRKLYSMMGDIDSYDISGSNTMASRTRDEFNKSYQSETMAKNNNNVQGTPVSEIINNTFNITGSNAKDIAEEVSRVLQNQVDRRKAKWAT